jgi:2-aminoethylphosphonate transport system substrate-binding protein
MAEPDTTAPVSNVTLWAPAKYCRAVPAPMMGKYVPVFLRRIRVVAACAALAAAGCSTSSSSATSGTTVPSDYCTGTHPHGQVTVYSAPGLTYWYSRILSNFESNCAVQVYYESATSADLLTRVFDESGTASADIVVAQPPYISKMADLGLLHRGQLAQARSVPADRCDAQRRWCTVVDNFISWVYNTSLLVSAPTSYDDLLGSTYHGKIVTARVDSSIDGFGSLALLTTQLGVGAGVDTARRMESNVAAHYNSADAMGHAVANGAALVADGDLAENLNDVSQYGHLAVWFPVVGGRHQTLAVPFAAALVASHGSLTPARADERDNANALLAYMWSVAGQQAVGAAYGAPARPDVTPTDSRSLAVQGALAGVQIVRGNWEQLLAQQSQLTASWLALRHAPDGIPLPALTPTAPSLGAAGSTTTPSSIR